MIIKNFLENDIELDLNNLTFITSSNVSMLNNLYAYFKKYFSNYKFSNDELLHLYFEKYPTIYLDNNNELSRDYYKAVFINSYNDIDDHLQLSKDSLLFEYNATIMDNIIIQEELEKINVIFDGVNKLITKQYPKEYIFEIEKIEITTDFLLKKNFKQYISYKFDYKNKIIQLINLVYDNYINNPKKYLIYINNIDSMFNEVEYNEILSYIKNKLINIDVFVIISSKESKYIFVDDYELVNILNYKMFDKCLNEHELLKKINNNIEKNIQISSQDLKKFLLHYGSSLYEKCIIEENYYYIEKAIKESKIKSESDTNINFEFENIIEI